jgi:hypothetical protein
MMEPTLDPPSDVAEAAAGLLKPRPLRRGSMSERYMKCGQPTCRCHEDPEARHGPYFSVSRVVEGQTRSRYLTGEQAELARQQIEAGQQFRQQVEQYWQACERWADAELEGAVATAEQRTAEKGGSRRPSRRTSAPRSKRS